ncbi:MAG: DUF4404 family protein [Victivallales bacterium]|nr:DUF4404 family protein [Victivallales bacterium]
MKQTLQEIKDKIAAASGLEAGRKAELTELVDKLYTELEDLARTDRVRAENVSGLARASATEAVEGHSQEDLGSALDGLSGAVEQLEASHPRIVAVVNRICNMLSDIGI